MARLSEVAMRLDIFF